MRGMGLDGMPGVRDAYRFKETEISCECSVPIRLAAHLFVSLQTMPSARFAFGRWMVDIAV